MELKKTLKKQTLYYNFVNSFINCGNRRVARSIIDTLFLLLSQNLSLPVNILIVRVYLGLNSFIEVKSVKIKRRTYNIPFSMNFDRRLYLILKWIKNAILCDKRRLPTVKKLYLELISLLSFNNISKSLKLKENNRLQAISNRANLHFRW